MPNFLKTSMVASLVVFLTGCGTSGMTVRSYTEDRPRVDQDMQGNSGYMMGSSGKMCPMPTKSTRKMYILEVSKPAFDDTDAQTKNSPSNSSLDESPEAMDVGSSSAYDSAEAMATSSDAALTGSVVDYKVQKDDTLQKISKKFYNSYSQWPKIYELNKDKITDPNHIKPGITIQIPQ